MEVVVNKLEAMVKKADSDLSFAEVRLEREFAEEFSFPGGDEVNPMKLLARIHKAKTEFSELMKDICDLSKEEQILGATLQQDICTLLTNLKHVKMQCGKEVDNVIEMEEEMKAITNKNKQQGLPDLEDGNNSTEDAQEPAGIEELEQSPEEKRCGGKVFVPITPKEFDSVSWLIKGKSKLDEVNKIYEAIFKTFKKKSNSSNPLTPKDMMAMGLKVTGASGEAKIKVLRSLKIVHINKEGSVMMKYE